ncbi:MAG: hypothetical protein GYB31_08695 [Bacteroidetes bacterium]|nr:hypothetical protein [Bacteroidota bacterium]
MKISIITLIALVFFSGNVLAQTPLLLFNPDFEESPAGASTTPEGWIHCGFPRATPPDVHGMNTQFAMVADDPKFGEQYVGLVARDNNTWEDLGQKLEFPLEANKWHFLSFYAKKADIYRSRSQATGREINLDGPLVMLIYGSSEACAQEEMLAVTPVLDYGDWTKVSVSFVPTKAYDYFWFEVHYDDPEAEPYNGNVLLDNFSPIQIWTDTLRYFPLTAGQEFVDWVDRETLSNEQLQEFAVGYVEAGIRNGSIDHSAQAGLFNIFMAEQFLNELQNKDIRQVLLNSSSAELITYKDALETIGAEAEAELFKEGYSLVVKSRLGESTEADNTAFDQLPERFAEVQQIEGLLATFVESNRESLIQQLQW